MKLNFAFNTNTIIGFLFVLLVSCNSSSPANEVETNNTSNNTSNSVQSLTFQVLKQYPHDESFFTEGLEWHDSLMYEGTGLEGKSKLVKYQLKDGKMIKSLQLDKQYFGEGITILNNKIYQLTYTTQTVMVYDKSSWKKINQFNYEGEGWGLTNNGKQIIMSNGSNKIVFRNPENFKIEKTIEVNDQNGALTNINELEYVQGYLYANVWQTNIIVKINAENGKVVAAADLTNILQQYVPNVDLNTVDVLNGIAYDSSSKHFFVTGKLWPRIFEIQFN